jgi:hypothetical protein
MSSLADFGGLDMFLVFYFIANVKCETCQNCCFVSLPYEVVPRDLNSHLLAKHTPVV